MADHVSDSDDEEIDEDDAFNSEDERKYGALLGGKNEASDDDDDDNGSEKSDDDDDSDGIASEDDEEGGDGGQYMLNLLNNLDKKEDNTKKEKEEARKAMAHSALIQESEFSTVVKGSDLTLDQLMNGITGTKGFGTVQKTMKDMVPDVYDEEKRLSTTKAPVAKVVSDRAQRKIAYQENVEEVSQWTSVTKQNREAETLDFRPKERIKITKDELVGKFEPTTDFEKEVAAALEEAGAADEKELMKDEEQEMFGDDEDDLGSSKLSVEEYRKRRGELAKMRALLFYDEQKRHHINKIKSKKYRKIRQKQRTRLQEGEEAEAVEEDEEYAKEVEEKAEMERMKERMSLKHRNTSKWAKRVLRRGAHVDKDTRKAFSEQVRIGDELKRKMQGANSDDSGDDDVTLLDQAKALLLETEEKEAENGKNNGLFRLDFMKKGLDAQRERAKEEARELLRELEANDDMDSGDDLDMHDNENEEEPTKKRKKTASAKEMEKVLPKGKLVARSLEFGNSNAVSVSGAIDLNPDSKPVKRKSSSLDTSTAITLSSVDTVDDGEEDTVAVSKRPKRGGQVSLESKTEEETNPWIRSSSNEKKPSKEADAGTHNKKRKKNLPSVSKQGIINVADAVNVLSGDTGGDDRAPSSESTADKDANNDSKIATLTQEELVRKAFATPSDKDIEEDFEKEKNAMTDRDDHGKKKKEEDKQVSGWGSWAGDGAPAPRPPKKLPKHLAAPEKKVQKRRRTDDGKKNVIISAKRVKKTAKFQIESIPHPYSSREQYERAMAGGMGQEWNVTGAVKNLTRPEILTRAGKMIRPITKKAKVKRAPLAKFK